MWPEAVAVRCVALCGKARNRKPLCRCGSWVLGRLAPWREPESYTALEREGLLSSAEIKCVRAHLY